MRASCSWSSNIKQGKDSSFPKHNIRSYIYQPGAFTEVADGQINVLNK